MKKSSKRSENTSLEKAFQQVKEAVFWAAEVEKNVNEIFAEFGLKPKEPSLLVGEPNQILEHLFKRFSIVTDQLVNRYNERPTLKIKDEYDVQDLLHSLLKIYFEDIRPEEYAPSYGGVSPRIDLLLKNEQIVIECKKTRDGLGRRKLRDELIIDKEHYRTHPDCKILYCFVYDPERKIRNPRGFERDLSGIVDGFETKVFIIT